MPHPWYYENDNYFKKKSLQLNLLNPILAWLPTGWVTVVQDPTADHSTEEKLCVLVPIGMVNKLS